MFIRLLPEARPNAWTCKPAGLSGTNALSGSGTRNSSWSSVLLAGDRLYAPNQNADVFVLRASTNFTVLATNSIGGERMNASLAVSNGDIFLRTYSRLWCMAEK